MMDSGFQEPGTGTTTGGSSASSTASTCDGAVWFNARGTRLWTSQSTLALLGTDSVPWRIISGGMHTARDDGAPPALLLDEDPQYVRSVLNSAQGVALVDPNVDALGVLLLAHKWNCQPVEACLLRRWPALAREQVRVVNGGDGEVWVQTNSRCLQQLQDADSTLPRVCYYCRNGFTKDRNCVIRGDACRYHPGPRTVVSEDNNPRYLCCFYTGCPQTPCITLPRHEEAPIPGAVPPWHRS
ncbi:hypothetical protein Pelo_11618 [Pelomyxa schiedti]|nr:hypothetical protein Pelo_11618 [Pelomyxa schiedti]